MIGNTSAGRLMVLFGTYVACVRSRHGDGDTRHKFDDVPSFTWQKRYEVLSRGPDWPIAA